MALIQLPEDSGELLLGDGLNDPFPDILEDLMGGQPAFPPLS